MVKNNNGPFEVNIHELPQFYDKDAEAALIALSFQDVDNYSIMREAGVSGDWFVGWQPRRLFEVFNTLFNQAGVNEISDFTVMDALNKLPKEAEPYQITQYFREVTSRDVPNSYTARYISRLLKAHQRRLQYTAALRWAQMAVDGHVDGDNLLGLAEQDISLIRRVSSPIEVITGAQMATETEAFYRSRLENGAADGDVIPYKLTKLQEVTKGIRRQELTLISAPPKVGKTALMQRIAKEISDDGYVVLYISLEMPRIKWIGRIIQQETGIDSQDLETGRFSSWQHTVFEKLDKLKGSKFYFIDDTSCTTETIKRAIEHVKRVEGVVHAVFIDYAQLLKDKLSNDNETARYIAGELKSIPKKYDTHLFSISNLNRQGELYGSTFFEYNCDNWWVVENERATQELDPSEKSGEAKILVKYQRYGNSGHPVPVYWNNFYARFTDRDKPLPKPYGGNYAR